MHPLNVHQTEASPPVLTSIYIKLPFILFFLFAACFSLQAIETNTFFPTDDGHIYLDTETGKIINPRKVEEAKKIRESWPAQNFSEGNWGEVDHGCQLSLRFDKLVYTNGEFISAVVLVRNATNDQNYLVLFLYSNKITGGSINYSVYAASNTAITLKPSRAEPRISAPSSTGFRAFAHTQRKFSDHLNDMFDLTNGVYFVQASVSGHGQLVDTNRHPSVSGIELPKALGKMDFIELKSAKVRIEIK